MSDRTSAQTQAPSAAPSTFPVDNPSVQVELKILHHALVLGTRKSPRRISVKPGRVFVLAYGYETFDVGGFPEVYLYGEEITKRELRDKAECWAIELAEFPGKIDFSITRRLAAISRTEEDVASVSASYSIRLWDPLKLLRRSGGQWEENHTREAFNQERSEEIEQRLKSILHQSGLRLWSGDEQLVFDEIRSQLDDLLKRTGLRVNFDIDVRRRYPRDLYELGLQFRRSEQVIRHESEEGQIEVLTERTGLSSEDLRDIAASSERLGVRLFRVLIQASESTKERASEWLKRERAEMASAYVEELYSGEYSEQEVKLSEQVVRWAIRNPMLTIGEWLQEESPPHRPIPFERRQSRLKTLSAPQS